MPMTPDKIALVQQHISIHAGACKACGNTSWGTNNELLSMPIFSLDTKAVNIDKVNAFAVGHCTRCGNSVFFHAQKIEGLL